MRVLLDFDGVVLRDRRMSMYQTQRSAKFVSMHTHLSMKTADFINKKFYPKHGHTVLFLRERFFRDVSLEEYNEFVFDKNVINKLMVTQEALEYGKAFRPIFEEYETYVFTNAHVNWVEHFANIFDLPMLSENIIYPLDLTYLKPNELAYDSVEASLGNDLGMKIFIDDAERNLEYPRKLGWQTVLWTEKSSPLRLKKLLDRE